NARDRVGTRAVRCHFEGHTRRTASSETFDNSLSRNRLDRTCSHTSARAGNSVVGALLVDRGWHCLHGRHFIFCERAAALWAFHLHFVRVGRPYHPFSSIVCLRNLKRNAWSWKSFRVRRIN